MIDESIEYEPIDNDDITFRFIFTFIYNLYFSSVGENIRNELVKYKFTTDKHLFLDSNK